MDVDYPTIPRVTNDSGVDVADAFGVIFGCLAQGFIGSPLGKVMKVVSRASREPLAHPD